MNTDAFYGFKMNQTQGFDAQGLRVALTQIKIEPATVAKAVGSDKIMVTVGWKKHVTRPLLGLLKNFPDKITPRYFRELNTKTQENNDKTFDAGTKIAVSDIFVSGDKIKVTGKIKGKGFQGVMRRHGFHGAPKTHGTSTVQRHPGSIGAGTTPGRIYKGKRMGGHMGMTTVTIKGLEVFEVRPEENMLVVKGLVPGGKGTLLKITKIA